jgi:hypothetical protein
MAEVVLGHGISQRLPWNTTEGLLAVARRDPDVDPADARLLVRQALALIVEAEIVSARRGA